MRKWRERSIKRNGKAWRNGGRRQVRGDDFKGGEERQIRRR